MLCGALQDFRTKFAVTDWSADFNLPSDFCNYADDFFRACSMDLGSRRWGQAHEDDDAVTAWVPADSVDVEIGFPVVNEPKIAGLIYVDLGATHHWDEGWRPWRLPITVQRYAVMQ